MWQKLRKANSKSDQYDGNLQAEEARVKISGVSEHYIQKKVTDEEPILLLGYGKLNEDEIKEGLLVLDEIIKKEECR